jgi:uncharacterized protein (UPF0548 family)
MTDEDRDDRDDRSTLDARDGIGETPDGYRRFQRRIRLGTDDLAFERGRAMLRAWGPQIGAGMRLDVGGVPVKGGTDVLRVRIAGIVPIRAPFVVCWTTDERDRAGHAYQTLPGHPEDGRESFIVTRDRTDHGTEVWFTVTAYSRPAAWFARLGGPVTRILQNRYTNKYLLAMAVGRTGRRK